MKIVKRNGFSAISMIVFVILFGIVGILGFQIGMGYLDQQTIKGAVRAALQENKSLDNITAKDIKTTILKKLSVTTVDVKDNDVTVEKNADSFDVEVDFTKEIPITNKIKIVMDLTVTQNN